MLAGAEARRPRGDRRRHPRRGAACPHDLGKDGKQVESNEIEVEIAPNIRVTVLRETITSVVRPTAANDTKPVKEKAG